MALIAPFNYHTAKPFRGMRVWWRPDGVEGTISAIWPEKGSFEVTWADGAQGLFGYSELGRFILHTSDNGRNRNDTRYERYYRSEDISS